MSSTTNANGKTFQPSEGDLLTYPPGGGLKWLFKAPLVLWRLGLGPLLGQMFVLMTHTGRKSGLPRRTMTELHIVDGRKYVPSGYGAQAQWYKNLMADPLVTLQSAGGVERMKARRVTDGEELFRVVQHMRARTPVLDSWLESLGVAPTFEDISAKKDRLYILTFDPTDEPTPPPQETDLVWVWWVLAAVVVLLVLWGMLRPRQQQEKA